MNYKHFFYEGLFPELYTNESIDEGVHLSYLFYLDSVLGSKVCCCSDRETKPSLRISVYGDMLFF